MRFKLTFIAVLLAFAALIIMGIFGPRRTIMVHWCYGEPKTGERICKTLTERELEEERRKVFPELYK